VVPGLSSPQLGKNACAKMALIRLVCSVMYYNWIDKYDHVFRRFGCLPGVVDIQIDKAVSPIVYACRMVPFAEGA